MKCFSFLLLAFLLTALSPLLADQPVDSNPTQQISEEQNQNQAIAGQLAPLYKEQFHLLRSNAMLYQVYEKSDSAQKLALQRKWGQYDGLFNERKEENFNNPENILDALGLEYALHLELITMSYSVPDDRNGIDEIASTSLSAEDFARFNHFANRLPQVGAGDPYDMEHHDTTKMISNEELRQHPLSNIIAMEASFLKLELLSLLLDMRSSQEVSVDGDNFIKSLDQLSVENYNDLVAAQHKMVDLENKLRAPLLASQEAMKSMEEQERGIEIWSHISNSDESRSESALLKATPPDHHFHPPPTDWDPQVLPTGQAREDLATTLFNVGTACFIGGLVIGTCICPEIRIASSGGEVLRLVPWIPRLLCKTGAVLWAGGIALFATQ